MSQVIGIAAGAEMLYRERSETSWYFCDNTALDTWVFFPFLFLLCSITSKICKCHSSFTVFEVLLENCRNLLAAKMYLSQEIL